MICFLSFSFVGFGCLAAVREVSKFADRKSCADRKSLSAEQPVGLDAGTGISPGVFSRVGLN
jgi:hypothetical protein